MIDKRIFIVIFLVLVIFSSVTLLYSGSLYSILSPGGEVITREKSFCKETDDGSDYYKKGVTYGKDGNEIYDNFDFCEDSEILHEWYCRGSKASSKKYKCPNGCDNGICIN